MNVFTAEPRTRFAAALSRMYGVEVPAKGLAYYRGGDPTKPVVYEDFLPISAAGIFRSNLDAHTAAVDADDQSGYSADWLAGAIGQHVHDP